MGEEEKFNPRDYQAQLMEIAIRENTIIYLPTGSGKTFIAIMTLKALSSSLSSPYSGGGKISIILVNSVALVDQHAKYILDHTIFTVGTYTGEMNLDFWRKEEWEAEFNKHQVIIMTSQILVNLINSNMIDLERVNLIIFDECHRGVDDQPMRQIMKTYNNFADKPRILGLTATLLNGNCKLNRVMQEVRALETTYHSKVATVDGLDAVVGYSTNPREMFKVCNSNEPSTVCNLVIDRLVKINTILSGVTINSSDNNATLLSDSLKILEPVDVLKNLRNLISDLIIHIKMMGTFGGYKACIAHLIQVERIKKHCQEQKIFIILNYVVTMFGWAKTCLFRAMEGCSKQEQVRRFSSDKILKLLEILNEYKSQSNEPLCCLIFVQRRFTAKVIHHILQSAKQYDEAFRHIKSNFMVGNQNNPYNDTRENQYISKKNKEVLDSFVNKEINVLVSSNVLEEGVDIPKCTIVVKFDKSEDYRSYIQSKGRARHKSSLYYTIVEQVDQLKFSVKYKEFQKIETLLNELFVGKNSERTSPSKDEIDNMYMEDELDPYYVNGPNSAQVNMTSSVALLCRYCSNLASDQYTTYAPEWYVEEAGFGRKCRVIILLPTICPISQPIKGEYMSNKKSAKRAAALKACIQLHKCGELGDDLLPIKNDIKEEDVSYLFEHWPSTAERDAGNKKKKRLYDRQVSDCVQGRLQAGSALYLHVIKFNPTFTRSDDPNSAIIYDLYKSDLCFGVLTPKPLPELCKFPLYDSYGTIEIEIKVNARQIDASEAELMLCREFHYLIFNDLLEILKPFLIFDNDGLNSEMLLVVPVKDNAIDLDVLQEHKALKSKQLEATSTERLNLRVSEEEYLHKIVSPWYRTQPTMYVVTRVCFDKNALSDFPNRDFRNFAGYYQEKHGLNVLNSSQPLLLVKGLSKRLNALKPRGRESKRRKEKRFEELEEYLVPELVVKQEFPACLWVQARFLPSILSRVSFLLKLQRLQTKIARDIGAKAKYLQNCTPLELDIHLLNYVPADSSFPVQTEESNLVVNHSCLQLEAPPTTLLTQQYNKDFATKMLEGEYSWRNIEEPKDIEREINVSVMDIDFYETFISKRVSKENRLLKNDSPKRNQNLKAITYNKEFEEKSLQISDIEFDNQSPNLCSIYQAMTTAEANDIVNLERLETLGDSFLKLIASLYIYFKFPKYNEGASTTLKGKLVSNKNLYYLAKEKKLGGILKNRDLSPNDEWVPPCFCIPEVLKESINNQQSSIVSLFHCNIPAEEQITAVLSRTTLNDIQFEEIEKDEENSYMSMCNFLNKQYVSDKTTADSVEALLGAYFQSGGITGGIKFVEWIGIIPPSEHVEDLIRSTVVNPILDLKATKLNVDFHMPQADNFETRLGYTFKNRAFLLQALTHASYSPNRITQSYERLEFIGDAILDFLITSFIYEHCGYLNPGEVTDLRSALVNNNTFASLVVRCGLHKFLLMINSKLQGHIDKFAEYLARKEYVIDDEVLILLEAEDLNIAEYVDVPKVLGDIFEALVGAVYLDCNKDLKTVWKVVYKIMWREMDLFSKNVPKNVIRRLFECPNAHPRFSKATELDNQKTMVCLEFMCEGRKKRVHGFGTNKAMAKRAAAKIALRALAV